MLAAAVTRRGFVAGAAALCAAWPATALASDDAPRVLRLRRADTGETLAAAYARGDRYDPGAVAEVSALMRDARARRAVWMDLRLLDILWYIAAANRVADPVLMLSGYRTLETNQMLADRGEGAARNSYHMLGRAVDVAVPGVDPRTVAWMSILMRRGVEGGTGYYPARGFVHIDTGPLRVWTR
jgi:uncharacterized protein YcbK (DUF882 family)